MDIWLIVTSEDLYADVYYDEQQAIGKANTLQDEGWIVNIVHQRIEHPAAKRLEKARAVLAEGAGPSLLCFAKRFKQGLYTPCEREDTLPEFPDFVLALADALGGARDE